STDCLKRRYTSSLEQVMEVVTFFQSLSSCSIGLSACRSVWTHRWRVFDAFPPPRNSCWQQVCQEPPASRSMGKLIRPLLYVAEEPLPIRRVTRARLNSS